MSPTKDLVFASAAHRCSQAWSYRNLDPSVGTERLPHDDKRERLCGSGEGEDPVDGGRNAATPGPSLDEQACGRQALRSG